MQRVVIIDYGSGNLHSANKSVQRAANEAGLEIDLRVTASTKDVEEADRIILPGVGAFADCKSGLTSIAGMLDVLQGAVIERQRPFLGICVGMQLMATRGLEFGKTPGFDWITGDVSAIEPSDPSLKIPHMGWNTLQLINQHDLLEGIALGANGLHAYFVHSFHLQPADPSTRIATTDYGVEVTAMVGRDNIVGTQFHPEKSQKLGLKLLENFLRWQP